MRFISQFVMKLLAIATWISILIAAYVTRFAHTNLLHTAAFPRMVFSSFICLPCFIYFDCTTGGIHEFVWHVSLDVSEESEYDLWSDRFGSWIGRSSKSKSPDSFKHLRYDRKSSSGYNLLFIVVLTDFLLLFVHFLFIYLIDARFPHAILVCFIHCFVHVPGGVSSASPDFFEATGRRSSSGND